MKNISLKTTGIFILAFSLFNLGWSIYPFAGMNLTPEQHQSIVLPGILIWVSFVIVGVIIFTFLTKPIENKYNKLTKLTDKELLNISKKSLNINIVLAIVYGIIFLMASFASSLVYATKFGEISVNYSWSIAIPAIIIHPFLMYSFVSLLYSKINREFYNELNIRELSSKGIKVNIRTKLLAVFGAIVIAMILWIGFFAYYTGINQMIEEIMSSRPYKLNAIVDQNIQDSSENELIEKINKIPNPDNEILIIVDSKGNIISKYDKSNIFEKKVTNISKIIQNKFKDNNSFYDNINQNVFSFKSINKLYKLILITNIDNNLTRMHSFWLWFLVYFFNGITILLLVAILFSVWINKSTNNLQGLFEELSENNLSLNATKDSEDEFGIIADKYNIFIAHLRSLIDSIQNSSVSVLSAGSQLSTASQQLSQNADEQAATTEEISSSMEQMLAMINSNTQNAEITGKTSEKSANEIKQSNEIFIKTIKSVSEISERISIITEIADKTDILSINAAIEAARAGESGRGFAVVANEIRKLADKTKIASDEISKLSKNGQDVSKIAGKALEKVIPKIIKSAELVNSIVSAGKEQQSGVEMINTSIQQLTEITNQNSASSEEMAASAEELSAQAEQLKELISVFKIGDL